MDGGGRACKPTRVSDPVPEHAHPSAASPSAGGGPAEADWGGEPDVRDLAEIPAIEVITRAAVMLMSAAAEKLGLAEDGAQHLDLDEARRLIHALAGLFAAAQSDLGIHRAPLRDGLEGLKAAFREASIIPDAPGEGPGEKLRPPPPL